MGEIVEPNSDANPSADAGGSPITQLLTNRIFQIAAGVGVALVILLVIVGFVLRGGMAKPSADSDKPIETKNYKYLPVFEQLTPMDAAQIREALSFENIPFKSEKNGRIINISIPKKWADEARIKMAQLGLPEGGVVGFEIFDKSQSLGATEYDKRMQYMRAISGELSRLISHMKGINSARVQIVLPEQKTFGDRTPGSASVLLNVKSKQNITDKQIKGIMHLVASSVEDIKPEDVTVVDNAGAILSERVKLSLMDKRQSMLFDMLSTPDDDKKSPLEMLLRFKDQLKANYENDYSQKVKQILATLYPMGSYLVFVNVDLKESEKESTPYVLNKIDVAILLDASNRDIKLTNQLKDTTTSLVSTAIGYQEGRDSIVIDKGPFTSIDSEQVGKLFPKGGSLSAQKGGVKKAQLSFIFKFIYAFVLITLLFIFVILRYYNSQKERAGGSDSDDLADGSLPAAEDQELAIEKFRAFAQNNEEQVMKKLMAWLSA